MPGPLPVRGFFSFRAIVASALALAACTGDDPNALLDGLGPSPHSPSLADASSDALAWVSPSPDAVITVGDVVVLTVRVADPSVNLVRFDLDGAPVGTCDAASGDECHRGDLFRQTSTFHEAGSHVLVATSSSPSGGASVSLAVNVRDASAQPLRDGGSAADGGPPGGGAGVDRGFLDPDQPKHNVFDGVSWDVSNQHIDVDAPPSGSVTTVATCMQTYGASIIAHADENGVSRAAVVATAITESNCTNPAGSVDGLSSGPMQVTGATCAAVATEYSSSDCKAKMHADPDFSFAVGAKYMGSSYQVGQHHHDPPKYGAAYNAGSIRSSTANRWHMVVTGDHLERWVGAYNAYRDWERSNGIQRAMPSGHPVLPTMSFEGEHVADKAALPPTAREGQVYFVGDWANRRGAFMTFRGGAWRAD